MTLPGFVLKVSFGDTSTHLLYLSVRGRIFLNRCNFWLFPSKKKKNVLILIHFLLPLPLTHSCRDTHVHARTLRRTQTRTSTHRKAGRPLVQPPRPSGVGSGLPRMMERQIEHTGRRALMKLGGLVVYRFLTSSVTERLLSVRKIGRGQESGF